MTAPRLALAYALDLLLGDPSKAKQKLGWEPKYDLPALVSEMVRGDLALFEKQKTLLDNGYAIVNQYE